MTEQQLESWHSDTYAAEWAGDDVLGDMLLLPRRISAAIVDDAGIDVAHVVDLGSGPGAYLEVFLQAFPHARGTWTDSSEAMRDLAVEQLARFGDRVTFELVDAERLDAAALGAADVVLSSRVLHHFSPESLARVYANVHGLLRPGGFFFNLDHVGAPGDWEQVYRRVRGQFTGERKKALAPHRQSYPLAPTDDHLAWARDAGFDSPDVAWRTLYTALIVARRAA